jgi:NADH-quinone oxidoreductase subunit G
MVKVSQAGATVMLPAVLDKTLPANVVRLAAGHQVSSQLGAMFGAITVERA